MKWFRKIVMTVLMSVLLANAAHAIMVAWTGIREDGLRELCVCNIDSEGRTRCVCGVWNAPSPGFK
jgi:hypothetical protein